MSTQPKTIYFVLESNKIKRGKKALNIYRITADQLMPTHIGQAIYRPASTRGQASEVAQYLVDFGFEVLEGWNQSSYWGNYISGAFLDNEELSFKICVNTVWLEIKDNR